jgi:exoribonuclease-2
MDSIEIPQDSLVLYKKHPARVTKTGERLEIELGGGETVKVRPKDVLLLHPGPLKGLAELKPQEGEVELAWEILQEGGGTHTLAELAELIYGQYTPATAWAAWRWVEDGLYFHGAPQSLAAHSAAEAEREKTERERRASQAKAWEDFLQRARTGRVSPDSDGSYIREVEELALGQRQTSRILHALGHAERPENAHALLLEWGCWSPLVNPYPRRLGLTVSPPDVPLDPLPDEPRLDLTHLAAYAIDDVGNQDPDDALSLEECWLDSAGNLLGGRVWVHVADAAALVSPDSPADREARLRGSTLYLPEGRLPMLPEGTVANLGLGLQEISPALSFGLEINSNGQISDIQIQPSRVRVLRLTYEQVEMHLDETPFHELYQIGRAYQARRRRNGALLMRLPEAILGVEDGQVSIRPVLRLHSRELVQEAMMMAGEAAASFAIQRAIPFPFATQEASGSASPEKLDAPEDQTAIENLAAAFALLRTQKRGQVSSQPAPHAGVGLPAYSRATSPLRRYLDLVAHQQLRAFLHGKPLLNEQQMLERVGESEAVIRMVAQAESLSRRHWTLVYLAQHPGWRGEGVLVEKVGLRGRVILPELAFETQVHLREDLPLNTRLPLAFKGANLAELEAFFAVA